MKKKIIYIFLLILCFCGVQSKIKACSPIKTSPPEALDQYNFENYLAVEGYYISATKFVVTRSSNSSIKINNEYKVFEFGPFGDMCEEYELQAQLEPEFIGIENPLILILYKDRSVNGKLVAPLFWHTGLDIDISNNKVRARGNYELERDFAEWFYYEYSTDLDKIKQRLFENKIEPLEWTKKALWGEMIIEDLPEDYIFQNVQTPPLFPDGKEAFMIYFAENIKCSDTAHSADTRGTIYISFIVERDGSITDIKVPRGIGFGIDEEAIRIVQMMPKWIPGKLRGSPVRVRYVMPIKI